ncbi:MAG TPA: hypothetical protein VET48_12365, partial [Steroidobacteraceae bacterium]|nr:hypothetical protein [Steroidobacteraceae bacterium]
MKATQLRDLTAIRVEMFLRIKHPSIDPQEITEVLGLQPEHATKAGLETSAKGVKRLFSESYWLAHL